MRVGPRWTPTLLEPVASRGVGVRNEASSRILPPEPATSAPVLNDAPWPQTLMEMSAVVQHLAQRRADRFSEETGLPNEEGEDEEIASEEGDGPGELSSEERAQVDRLVARDTEVRAHEAAHAAVAGALGGAPSFVYQRGPDGKQYAIGGSVPINTSEGSTPEETLARAEQVRAAALAPSNPSGADRAIAAAASSMAARARMEMAMNNRNPRTDRYAQNATPRGPRSTLSAVA